MWLGLPELLVVFVLAMFWVVPVAAAIWAMVTLHRIRSAQDGMRGKLEAIEGLIRGQTSRG